MNWDAFDEIHGVEFSPSADIYRMDDGWVVKLDLAGVRPQDVDVEVRGHSIHVSGVRRDQFVQRGMRHHSMEICYSRFERTLQLPCEASKAAVTTEYTDGLLIVTIRTGS